MFATWAGSSTTLFPIANRLRARCMGQSKGIASMVQATRGCPASCSGRHGRAWPMCARWRLREPSARRAQPMPSRCCLKLARIRCCGMRLVETIHLAPWSTMSSMPTGLCPTCRMSPPCYFSAAPCALDRYLDRFAKSGGPSGMEWKQVLVKALNSKGQKKMLVYLDAALLAQNTPQVSAPSRPPRL